MTCDVVRGRRRPALSRDTTARVSGSLVVVAGAGGIFGSFVPWATTHDGSGVYGHQYWAAPRPDIDSRLTAVLMTIVLGIGLVGAVTGRPGRIAARVCGMLSATMAGTTACFDRAGLSSDGMAIPASDIHRGWGVWTVLFSACLAVLTLVVLTVRVGLVERHAARGGVLVPS